MDSPAISRRSLLITGIGAFLAAAALLGIAPAASASPAGQRGPVLCARNGRGPCLTVRPYAHKAQLRNGHGSAVRIVPAGHVTSSWPFRQSPHLNGELRGLQTVQIRAGRWCAGGTGNGSVRLVRCSALSEWVRGWFARGILVSVRASDADGQPCALAVIKGLAHLSAVTLNGEHLDLQQWAVRRSS